MGACCQTLRRSELLQKCISTALAVGNVLNRGTARGGVTAIVLPDSMLKLNEMKTGVGGGYADGTQSSVLDFIAQALVDDSGDHPDDLCTQLKCLLEKVRAAQTVCLEEVEGSCNKILKEALTVQEGANQLPVTPEVTRVCKTVTVIVQEVRFAQNLLEKAKVEFKKLQQWASAKQSITSNDWLEGWRQFLDQFLRALSRARPSLGYGLHARLNSFESVDSMDKARSMPDNGSICTANEGLREISFAPNASQSLAATSSMDKATLFRTIGSARGTKENLDITSN